MYRLQAPHSKAFSINEFCNKCVGCLSVLNLPSPTDTTCDHIVPVYFDPLSFILLNKHGRVGYCSNDMRSLLAAGNDEDRRRSSQPDVHY